MLYRIICHATQEIEVEADNVEEAEQLATEKCYFPWVDYCEVEEMEK